MSNDILFLDMDMDPTGPSPVAELEAPTAAATTHIVTPPDLSISALRRAHTILHMIYRNVARTDRPNSNTACWPVDRYAHARHLSTRSRMTIDGVLAVELAATHARRTHAARQARQPPRPLHHTPDRHRMHAHSMAQAPGSAAC